MFLIYYRSFIIFIIFHPVNTQFRSNQTQSSFHVCQQKLLTEWIMFSKFYAEYITFYYI